MKSNLLPLVLAALVAAPGIAPGAAAQQAPADAVLRDFQPTGDYILEIDGQEYPKAKIYQSQAAAAILIRAAVLDSPVLLSPRAGSVESVSIMSLNMQSTGAIDILADAQLIPQGRFRIEGEEIAFSAEGHPAKLKPRPPLTGPQERTDLLEHSPTYGPKAKAYTPDESILESLRGQSRPVRVKVFFGSWCPFCQQYVPRMLKVEELLEGSKVEFDYYGLPKPPFNDDPAAKAESISGVPTGIVYVGDKEVGRIQGDQWTSPETTIQSLISGG